MGRWTRRTLAGALLVGSLAALHACTLRYDFTQCERDADCASLERVDPNDPASNEFYQCREQQCVVLAAVECREDEDCGGGPSQCNAGVCERSIVDPDAGDVGGDPDTGMDAGEDAAGDAMEVTCGSSQDCRDNPALGGAFACGLSGVCEPLGCADDAECASAFGSDFVCSPRGICESEACETTDYCNQTFGESVYCDPTGQCKETAREGCEPLDYPAEGPRDDVIILGSIVPTEGGFAQVGPTVVNGVRMAVDEFRDSVGRLLNDQMVAYLQCSPGVDVSALDLAGHMRDLGVPAVVGPLSSGNYLDVVTGVTGDRGPVTIAMGATSPAVAELEASGDYSFQIIANDRYQSSAIADRARDLSERRCEEVSSTLCTDTASCQQTFGADWIYEDDSEGGRCVDKTPKVVVFFKGDRYGQDLNQLVGQRLASRHPDAAVSAYEYADPAALGFDPARIQTEFGRVLSSSLSGAGAVVDPDVVLFLGTGEAAVLAKTYFSALENAGGDSTLPQYIFSHGAAADTPGVLEGLSEPRDYIERVEAVAPDILNDEDDVYGPWQGRYSAIFGDAEATSVAPIAYDAAFLHLFAMTAASRGGGVVSAANVSQALASGRFQDSASQKVYFRGLGFPVEVANLLEAGGSMDLVGVTGQLNFIVDAMGRNQGIVRSNYVGFDLKEERDPLAGSFYDVVPRRVYLLGPSSEFGDWLQIP